MSEAACAPPRLGGKTLAESFSDVRVIELTQAAITGDSLTVDRMAKAGVPVNAKGQLEVTPLLWAVLTKSVKGTEDLLRAGADPNQKTLNGRSALSWAAGLDQPALLSLLLRYGANPNGDASSKIDDQPLVKAAYEQRFENVKLLIEAGADVNIHDKFDGNAADTACSQGAFEITAYLLDHGYTFQLNHLAMGVLICHVPPGSDRQRWKDQVIEKLKAKGVAWPPVMPAPKKKRG